MNIIITGRKIDVTEGLKTAIDSKLKKFDKFFGDNAEAKITLSVERDRHTVELTVFSSGMIFRAEETTQDMYASIDKVADLMERQIRKNKTRLEKRLRDTQFAKVYEDFAPYSEDAGQIKIVKTKRHSIKPMSPEEAVLQMELLGHEFFVFQNDKTGETDIVYKRRGGDYGLIETE